MQHLAGNRISFLVGARCQVRLALLGNKTRVDWARSSTDTCTCRRFIALSCRKGIGGIAGGHAGRATAAAIFGEVGEQLIHRAVLGRIDELPAQASLSDKAGMNELREVERK